MEAGVHSGSTISSFFTSGRNLPGTRDRVKHLEGTPHRLIRFVANMELTSCDDPTVNHSDTHPDKKQLT